MKTTEPNAQLAEYARTVVVEEGYVEPRSREGYRLLHVIESSQWLDERMGQWDPQTGRNAPSERHIITRPLFVMGKHENVVIEEMRADVSRLSQALTQAQQLAEQTTKEKATAIAAEKHAGALLKDAQEENSREKIRTQELMARVQKMERDLACVRQHVGTKLFDEALGAKKS